MDKNTVRVQEQESTAHTHTVYGERESQSQDNNKGTELNRPSERLTLKQQNHSFKGKVKHQLAPCVSFKKGPAIVTFSCEFSKLQLLIRLLAFSHILRPYRLHSLQKKKNTHTFRRHFYQQFAPAGRW